MVVVQDDLQGLELRVVQEDLYGVEYYVSCSGGPAGFRRIDHRWHEICPRHDELLFSQISHVAEADHFHIFFVYVYSVFLYFVMSLFLCFFVPFYLFLFLCPCICLLWFSVVPFLCFFICFSETFSFVLSRIRLISCIMTTIGS